MKTRYSKFLTYETHLLSFDFVENAPTCEKWVDLSG